MSPPKFLLLLIEEHPRVGKVVLVDESEFGVICFLLVSRVSLMAVTKYALLRLVKGVLARVGQSALSLAGSPTLWSHHTVTRPVVNDNIGDG